MRTYAPDQVVVNFGNETITGFAAGTFVTAVRTVDLWEMVSGSDGEVTRIKQSDRSGLVTITLQQSSPSNTFLAGVVAADAISNAGVFPLLVKDFTSDGSLVTAANAFVKRIPDWNRASADESSVEWIFACPVLLINQGTGLLTTAVALGA
jgi:hypothetical protein